MLKTKVLSLRRGGSSSWGRDSVRSTRALRNLWHRSWGCYTLLLAARAYECSSSAFRSASSACSSSNTHVVIGPILLGELLEYCSATASAETVRAQLRSASHVLHKCASLLLRDNKRFCFATGLSKRSFRRLSAILKMP